jgi:glycosyltransferase involved in cell wall biosynthesis/SAM-dependent methyltransferase
MTPPEVRDEYQLAIVGRYSEQSRQRLLAEAGLSPEESSKVLFLQDLSDSLLADLYRNANLFVFPSFYEGFGLPVAEALTCCCPVIASNRSSLPEILTWQPATFDPENSGEIAEKMKHALLDRGYREQLVNVARRHSNLHTWEKVAKRSIDAMRNTLGRTSNRVRSLGRESRKIALVGPLPPVKSGIADYNHRVIEALEKYCELDVFVPEDRPAISREPYRRARVLSLVSLGRSFNPASYNLVLYSIGNSEHHMRTQDFASNIPGVIWQHDVNLPGLFINGANRKGTKTETAAHARDILRRYYGDRYSELAPSDNDLLNLLWYVENNLGMTRPILESAQGVIVHSKHARSVLEKEQGEDLTKLPVYHLPLACPGFSDIEDRRVPGRIQITVFGIVGHPKAPELLIKMCALLKKEHPSIQLTFVGSIDEPLRQALQRVSDEHGLNNGDVEYTGYVSADKYLDWLFRTDIAVTARRFSNGESSAAANDCLAAGLPVVSNLPAHMEYPDNVLLKLPFTASAADFAQAISRLLSSPSDIQRYRDAARAYAEKNSFETVARHILELSASQDLAAPPCIRKDRKRHQDFSHLLHALRTREIAKMPPNATRMLSIGCAGRWYFEWIKDNYGPVDQHFGIERFAPEPCGLPPEAVWLNDSVSDMSSIESGAVDLVFAGQTIEHLWPEETAGFLCEAHRVLKDKGTLVLDSPNRTLTRQYGWVFGEHTMELTIREASELLERSGFSVTSVRGILLCYDPVSKEHFPLEPDLQTFDIQRDYRALAAGDQPEHSFIWWITAAKNTASSPRQREVHRHAQKLYDRNFSENISRAFSLTGSFTGKGDARLIRSDGQAGFLRYGPFIPLPPGRYLVRFYYGIRHPVPDFSRDTAVARIDVTAGLDARRLAQKEIPLCDITLLTDERSLITRDSKYQHELSFEIDEIALHVQFRLQTLCSIKVSMLANIELL